MTQESVAPPARTTTATPDELAGRIEQELERLRAKRPGLSSRIDRAANLLVTHLACPRQRPIRVRVGEGRPRRFLVAGSKGAVYVVDPLDWSCTCPDHHRRDGAICKHALSCYVLVRASRPRKAPKALTCAACSERFPRRVMVEVTESLTFQEGDLLCTPCWIDSDAEAL